MRYETVHVRIDDASIAAADDHWTIIQPVWWTANIYEGPEAYQRSLAQFSSSQRLVYAVRWYFSEVNNGGHSQFYSNSTGIVWQDALRGLKALELSQFVDILKESARRLGGFPSLDREERQAQLERYDPDFEDLDDQFFATEKEIDVEESVLRYIQAHAAEFHFDGQVTRAVLPKLRGADEP